MGNILARGNFKPFFLVCVLLIAFAFFAIYAIAIEVAQVEPVKIRLIIPPGSSKSGTIKISNFSKEPKVIKVYLEDWVYTSAFDGSKEFQPAGTTKLSAANWISFSPAEFTLPAYGRQEVNYTVKVPAEAKGGHFAVLFFENILGESAKDVEEGVNVNLAVRIASLFYIEPKGTISRLAKIEDLEITRQDNRYLLTAKFSNIGNVDINTRGTFFVLNKQGVVYARGELNDVYTYPADTATLTGAWKDPLAKGKYDLVLTIDIGRALQDAGLGKIPALTKEAEIEVTEDAQFIRVSELK